MLGFDLVNMQGNMVRRVWDALSPIPGGKTVFSKLIGQLAPYTGTIDARVVELGPGYARVEMRDRRGVRNHLESVHAIALLNLAEVSSGLAVNYGIPDQARGILAGLSIDYVKKARGLLTAETRCEVPDSAERAEYTVGADIIDASGDVVARAQARWLIGPKRR